MCTATNKNRNHKQMIMKNKDSRSSLNMLPVDFEPSNNDVLCGRGNVYSNHYGNQFFGKVIRDNITVYKEATSRPDKIKVVDGILDQIRDNGARFTKVDTQTERWYELNDVQAHQKIGHAIRDTIRLLRKGGNNNNSISTSNKYTPNKEEKTRAIRTRRTSKSLVAKKKMFQQQKRQSRITIQREQLRQLVRSLDDEYVLEQQQEENDDDHYFSSQSLLPSVSSTFTLLEGYITNNNKESFLLEDEFPEHQFSFKASHFFERNNNDDETIGNNDSILPNEDRCRIFKVMASIISSSFISINDKDDNAYNDDTTQ